MFFGMSVIFTTALAIADADANIRTKPFGQSLLALSQKIQCGTGVGFAVSHGVQHFQTAKHGHIVQARLLVVPEMVSIVDDLLAGDGLELPFPFSGQVTAFWDDARTREVRVVDIPEGSMLPEFMQGLFQKDGHTVLSCEWAVHPLFGFARSDSMLLRVQSDKPLPESLKLPDGSVMPCHIIQTNAPMLAPEFASRSGARREARRGEGGAVAGLPPIAWPALAPSPASGAEAASEAAPAPEAAREPTGPAIPAAPVAGTAEADPAAEAAREEGEITPCASELPAPGVTPSEGEEVPGPPSGGPEEAGVQPAAEPALPTEQAVAELGAAGQEAAGPREGPTPATEGVAPQEGAEGPAQRTRARRAQEEKELQGKAPSPPTETLLDGAPSSNSDRRPPGAPDANAASPQD